MARRRIGQSASQALRGNMSKFDREARTSRPAFARRIDRLVGPIARPALKKHGFHEFHIFEHWADIVGDELAQDCVPLRLSRSRSAQAGSTLVIRVAGHRALDVEYATPQLLERLNTYLGGRAVSRLKLVQGPTDNLDQPPPSPLPDISAEAKKQVSESTKSIENQSLRAAIQSLGERVRQASLRRKQGR